MPFSRAIIAALTMLISGRNGLSAPVMAAAEIAFRLRCATAPSYSMRMPLTGASVSWPRKEPSFSASATKGLIRGASSAEIEGKFTALVIAPLSR